jgi:hypothetical protein
VPEWEVAGVAASAWMRFVMTGNGCLMFDGCMFDFQRATVFLLRLEFCGLGPEVRVGAFGPFCLVGIDFSIQQYYVRRILDYSISCVLEWKAENNFPKTPLLRHFFYFLHRFFSAHDEDTYGRQPKTRPIFID